MNPGLVALKSLEGRTIERIGCIGMDGNDGEDIVLSATITCTDGHRVHVVPQFWPEMEMPWLEITEGVRR